MRVRTGTAATLGPLLAIAITGSACGGGERNAGQSPPPDQFFFPAGVLLDPLDRQPPDELAAAEPDLDAVVVPGPVSDVPGPRYLFVANGNNDRAYNAGTLMAIDLRDFWRSWYDPYPGDARQQCLDLQPQAEAALEAARVELAAVPGSGLPPEEQELERQRIYDELRAGFVPTQQACDPRRGGVDPFCRQVVTEQGQTYERCVLPPGSDIGAETSPCRRLPLVPRIVECDERPFVAASVRVGDFATTLAASIEQRDTADEFARLWLPVRGDPSLTYVDVQTNGDAIELDCGVDEDDPERCNDANRLDQLLGDPELETLDREPFNALVWERPQPLDDPAARGQRLMFVAHSDGAEMSVVDLDGRRGGTSPTIVDLAPVYTIGASGAGGFGLAERPCFEAEQGPLGALDPEPNVPSLTQDCARPLIYTSMRFAGQLISFTASGLDVGEEVESIVPASDRVDCSISVQPGCDLAEPGTCAACSGDGCIEVYAGQYCATPDQVGQPCAVSCEPRVRGTRRIAPSLLLDSSLTSSAILGDMAFADPRGDQLLVLQTNPGALISLDTSLSVDGEPLDIPSAPPVELCAEPSRMKIYTERDVEGRPLHRYAIIACFRAALVYIVDLEALRVVDAVVVGTGPYDIAIDDAREVAYVINNLEFSVSVVDLSRRRASRFQELARLGLQDPFSQ